MHSFAREMARFVRMLLGWGELGDAFVIDPEYLGNMEQPRTTVAAAAGLRNGYASGIFTTLDLPYRVLGHNGGIAGFLVIRGLTFTRRRLRRPAEQHGAAPRRRCDAFRRSRFAT